MNSNLSALLIEDDSIIATQTRKTLEPTIKVDIATSIAQAKNRIESTSYDIFIIDRHLTDGLGTSLIAEIRAQHPLAAILMMTADPNELSIKEALAAGATDYVIKSPHVAHELKTRILIARQRIQLERRCKKAEMNANESLRSEMVGSKETLFQINEFIEAYGPSDANVLITGETGTGKELIARAINRAARDPSRPFIAVNCGAIAASLVESELFGHVRGSFTGAVTDRIGKIEEAHNGDLFLDEIGELAPEIQAKLLRVIELGTFSRTGENRVRTSRLRIIAATHRNLKEMIAKGLFREDLYYRLACGEICTIPLRDRKTDLAELITHFMKMNGATSRANIASITEAATNYDWPGNIRELRNAISRAAVLCKARGDRFLKAEDLGIESSKKTKPPSAQQADEARSFAEAAAPTQPLNEARFRSSIRTFEHDLIARAIRENQGSLMKTSHAIGMHLSTLYRKVAELGTETPAIKPKNSKALEKIANRSTNHYLTEKNYPC